MKHSNVLTREQIDSYALDVTDTLQAAGFQALLVGGLCSRSIAGPITEDFDVATNATPEEVRGLFRRSRMIGRRFRIVHVRYGREIIEVSTFRKSAMDDDVEIDPDHPNAAPNTGPGSDRDRDRITDDAGILLRDNVFGSLEEDAFRRDFTVNALYFDPNTNEVIDFVDGMQDLQDRCLRLIGEPKRRFTEDPVRLLRAIRFQAKLRFSLEPTLEAEIPHVEELLDSMPPARLFDEVSKLLLSGYGVEAWRLLCKQDLHHTLFPCTQADDPLVELAMDNTDDRLASGKGVTPGFLFAVLLWRDYVARFNDASLEHKPYEAAAIASDQTFRVQATITSIPRRISQFAKDTWLLQDRMVERRPRNIGRLISHQRFRAAYDFLVLRSQAGEPELVDAANWWTQYQDHDHAGQERMRNELSGGSGNAGDKPVAVVKNDADDAANPKQTGTVQEQLMNQPARHMELSGDLANRISQATLPRYIAVEGPIGVGKTTLTKRLAAVFGYQTLLEPVAENPFLDDFYRGNQHALATQLFFLLHRAKQIQEISSDDLVGHRIVADFLMAKDRLFAKLTLDEHEFGLYEQIFSSLKIRQQAPDLVIYLQAPVDVLLSRIRSRGVGFEQNIDAGYLETLIDSYANYFHFYDSAPLLIVNAAEIDLANNDHHFETLVERVMSVDGARQYFNPHPTLL